MINVAVKYFERHKDPKRLAWSYYYSGIISNELGEHVQSQLAFLKARSVALEIDEPKLLGRIYENLGNVVRYIRYMLYINTIDLCVSH